MKKTSIFASPEKAYLAPCRVRYEDCIGLKSPSGNESSIVIIFYMLTCNRVFCYECDISDDPNSRYDRFINMMGCAVNGIELDKNVLKGTEFDLMLAIVPIENSNGDYVDNIKEIVEIKMAKKGPNMK